MIRYVGDLALLRTIDRTVRLIDKTAQISGMLAPGLPLVAVHALLHHGPSAVPRREEPMEAHCPHRDTVDFRPSRLARVIPAVDARALAELS
ncbi:hypothetical protein ACVWW1_004292 [Bradyrhizobium sp. JR3.5]